MFSSLGAAHDGEIDWSYRTLPDGRNCQGMMNRHCVWHRGRAIGGTSNLDSMMYIRGGLGKKVAVDYYPPDETVPYF